MSQAQTKPRIGEQLVEGGLITQAQLQEALALQKEKGGKVVENLIALEYLQQQDFANFLVKIPGVASIDLLNYTIPQEIISLIPTEFALKHEVFPIDKMGNKLTVGMACPLDSKTVQALEEHTGFKVRPLLVSMNDIQVALNQHYKAKEESKRLFSMGDDTASSGGSGSIKSEAASSSKMVDSIAATLKFEGINNKIQQINAFPALPDTVAQVKKAIDDPESTAKDLSAIIKKDPSLAVKVISIANSAAYSLTNRVDNIDMAVGLLGPKEVYPIVLSSAVMDYFDQNRDFDYKSFWKRSMRCSITTRIIAEKCGDTSSGVVTAGLLHDTGKLVFAEISPARYKDLDQSLSDAEIIEREKEAFGWAHPEVGYILMQNWNLPSEILQPVRFHHTYAEATEHKEAVTIVALGAMMASAYGQINQDTVQGFAASCKGLLKALNLSDSDFISILRDSSLAIKEDDASN